MARIAVAGWQHETNSFASEPATLEAFLRPDAWPGLVEGEDLLVAVEGVNLPAAGFVAAAQAARHDVVPLLWASAAPSGPVCDAAFGAISARLCARLAEAGPVDALYLDLHGAMVTRRFGDAEGEILRRVRAIVGPGRPIVASLDLHANVSAEMVALSDALVAYETYPHVDMAETGARAVDLMARLLAGERFRKHLRRLPFLIPLVWQSTLDEPMRGLMAEARSHIGPGVASVSFTPGFPLADVACAGPAVIACGMDDAAVARAAEATARAVEAAAPAIAGRLYSSVEAVEEARRLLEAGGHGPVVLADTQDNPGAGGSGDTVGLARALAESGLPALVGVIHDPDAAHAAHCAGPGATIGMGVGAKSAGSTEAPLKADWRVESVGTGEFTGTGRFYHGCRFRLGPMALLRTGELRVAVASARQQAADQAMLRHLGVEPEHEIVIALKSSVHFRADFGPIARAVLIVAAPGLNEADPRRLVFRNLRPGVALHPQAWARTHLVVSN